MNSCPIVYETYPLINYGTCDPSNIGHQKNQYSLTLAKHNP